MVLDKQGWSDVTDLLNGSLDRLLEIQTESTARLGESKEEGTPSRIHLLHFKSPTADELKSIDSADEAKPAGS